MKTDKTYAVWIVTPNGVDLGQRIQQQLPGTDLYVSESINRASDRQNLQDCLPFDKLSDGLTTEFRQYRGHIFIMSTGIVVRTLAPLIRHKSVDPAVVVIDDNGRYVISLLSGHLGGANALAQSVADRIGATPIITTATDVNQLPAIDLIAGELGLKIENFDAIKSVHMTLLSNGKLPVHDPFELLGDRLPQKFVAGHVDMAEDNHAEVSTISYPGIFIDDRVVDLPPQILILRPATLAVGIGCNRDTAMEEIRDHLLQVMTTSRLALDSLISLASIDIKQDESGLLETAETLGLPIRFFPADELGKVKGIQNPSAVVAKHLGVSSVCEAAAILAADHGNLIVPKQTAPNVTVAIARIACTS